MKGDIKKFNENGINYNYSKPFVVLFNNNKFNNNIENKQTNEQYQDSMEFLKKFHDRIEIIGREGVKGILKRTNINVNSSYMNVKKVNDKLPQINNYQQNLTQPNYPSIVFDDNKRVGKSELIYDPTKENMGVDDWRKYPNVLPVNNNNNNNKNKNKNNKNSSSIQIGENIPYHDIYQERRYVPYSIRDYKEMMNNYNNNKLARGLGANIGTKDWVKRALKYQKMNLYCGEILSNNKGIYSYIQKTPNEARIYNLKKKAKESIRYKTRKYGKGVMLNKVRDEKRREKFEQLSKIENKEDNEIYNEVIAENRENYIYRLAKIKESLIKGV